MSHEPPASAGPPSGVPRDPLADTDATLKAASSHSGSRPSSPTLPAEVANAPPGAACGKFVVAAKLGAGGMGEVWRAWDTELARWVALKFLKGGDDEEIARFKREAQLAGALNHPNIAAIYEVGEDRGRHYIAMQFVEGRTLKAFPRGDARALAAVVRDAARAAAYAHAHGIVHRDLKPENLMVVARGAAGLHVYVMDFGLARATEGASDVSVSGLIVGTPSYMSPEQGRGDRVDGRADVFSLGVTVYELLTGRKPFHGDTVYETLKRVQEVDPRPPRALDPHIDADLETIVLKCLEKDREQRYASAGHLADDLNRWLEGEPIAARPASFAYRLRKRIAKSRAAFAVGALGLAVVAGVVALLVPRWLTADRERQKREGELAEQRERERAQKEAMERARPHIEAGRRLLEQMRLLARERYEPSEMLALGERAERELQSAFDGAPDLPEAHLELARVRAHLGDTRGALRALEKAIAFSPGFATAYLDRVRLCIDVYEGMRHTVVGNTRRETPDARALRERIEADLAQVERFSKENNERLYGQGLMAFAHGDYEGAQRILVEYLVVMPTDVQARAHRGHALYHLKRFDEAMAETNRAVDGNTRDAVALNQRGSIYLGRGDLRAALQDFTRAAELRPAYAEALTNRGRAREMLGDPRGAIADHSEALRLAPELVPAYVNRATAHVSLGDYAAAIADCEAGLSIEPRHATLHAARARARHLSGDYEGAFADFARALELNPEDAEAHVNRGIARREKGDIDGALADYDDAIRLDASVAQAWHNRGRIREDRGELEGALADYDEAIRRDPASHGTYTRRAVLRLERLGDPEGALPDFNRVVELRPQDPQSYYNRGNAFATNGDPEAAIRDFSKALELDPRHAQARVNRGNVRRQKGDAKGALEDLDEAVRIDPRLWNARVIRGGVRDGLGDHDGAIEDFTEALRLRPADPRALLSRGNARLSKRDFDGAIADFSEAVRLAPKYAEAYNNLGLARERKGDVDGAMAEYDRALTVQPRFAMALYNRGRVRAMKGDVQGAIADYTRALEVGTADWPDRPAIEEELKRLGRKQ